MREKRRGRRFEVVELEGHLLGSTDVTVIDISTTGLSIEAPVRLWPQRHYTVSLSDGSDRTGVSGRVVWCFLQGTQRESAGEVVPVYRAGIELERRLTDDPGGLVEVIERNARIQLERWVEGRFTVRSHEGVSVFVEYVFRIEKLSRTGMVAEVDLAPEPGSEFSMELRLDDGPCQVTGHISEVQRVQRNDGASTSLLTIEFVSVDEASREFLEEFVTQEVEAQLGDAGTR